MKEILNSSRTSYRTQGYRQLNHLCSALYRYFAQVPEEFNRATMRNT